MILRKGYKVKVIDSVIFDSPITEGTTGWITEVDLLRKGNTKIAFYPNGNRKNVVIPNTTDFDDYLEIIEK